MSDPSEPLLLLHFAFRSVVQQPDARLAELGLGRVHHRILFFVARQPGLRVVDLQATLGVSKQALHAPLQQLVQRKLVASRIDPGDRRERRLRLTSRGRRLELALSGHQRRLFKAAFQSSGPRATAGWHQVMRALAGERVGAAAALQQQRNKADGTDR